jgi:hypothetical protein
MLTQLSRSGQVLKLRLDDVRMSVTARFHIEGSILAETLASRPLDFDTRIEIDSPEARETLVRLLRLAEQSCYVMQSLLAPVRVHRSFVVNGEALEA